MLELRPYHSGDAAQILRWIDSETTFYRWSAGRYGDYPIVPETLEAAYADCGADGPYPMVMTDDGRAVGHLLLRYPDADRSIIRFGFVLLDTTQRSKGYGKQMIRLALAHAFDVLGARRVTIGVFADNLPALHCYQAAGFHLIPGLTEEYTINGQTWLCLELAIERPE